MLVFRSLAIGLLAACLTLLITRPTVELRVVHDVDADVRPGPVATHQMPTIIDVAPGVSISQLATLLRLAPTEHITAIDDVKVADNMVAGVALASLDVRSRRFIDLEIEGADGARRVLVLLH